MAAKIVVTVLGLALIFVINRHFLMSGRRRDAGGKKGRGAGTPRPRMPE